MILIGKLRIKTQLNPLSKPYINLSFISKNSENANKTFIIQNNIFIYQVAESVKDFLTSNKVVIPDCPT